jgi:glycosyltransferase involved in cell wall biosynthesis
VLSLIVPTFNKLPRLRLCLTSLEAQTLPHDAFEVIVVVDGSTDGTLEFLRSLRPTYELRVIAGPNGGRSVARNRGASAARSELLAFADDDVLLGPRFLEAHHARHASREGPLVVHGEIFQMPWLRFFADPTSGEFVAGLHEGSYPGLQQQRLSESDLLQRFGDVVVRRARVDRFEQAVRRMLLSRGGDRVAPWLGFTGGNVSVSKAAFWAVGGFDEALGRRWGCEDLELGYRLHGAGLEFVNEPGAPAYHLSHFRPGGQTEHRAAFAYFAAKHRDPVISLLDGFFHGEESIDSYIDRVRAASPSLASQKGSLAYVLTDH